MWAGCVGSLSEDQELSIPREPVTRKTGQERLRCNCHLFIKIQRFPLEYVNFFKSLPFISNFELFFCLSFLHEVGEVSQMETLMMFQVHEFYFFLFSNDRDIPRSLENWHITIPTG